MRNDDEAQLDFIRKWKKKRTEKKMQKLENKLEKLATPYFGHDVYIMYVRKD